MVLKPSRQTPTIALWLAGLLASAGLPEGVLSVLTGRERDMSPTLLDHPDLELAADTVAAAAFAQAGQRRTATSRLILWQEEVFGPVLAVCPADGFDQAVELANDSRYGLSAALFTRDLRLAYQFVERAEAGQVAVNLPTSGWDVHHPFGGFRDSGSPLKEQATPGIRFYTRVKTAAVRFAW